MESEAYPCPSPRARRSSRCKRTPLQDRKQESVLGLSEEKNMKGRTLERLQELLRVILSRDSLEGGDGLASVALLDTDVDSVG